MIWTSKQLRLIRGWSMAFDAFFVDKEEIIQAAVSKLADFDFHAIQRDIFIHQPDPGFYQCKATWSPEVKNAVVELRGGPGAGKSLVLKDIHDPVFHPKINNKNLYFDADLFEFTGVVDFSTRLVYKLYGWDDKRSVWIMRPESKT